MKRVAKQLMLEIKGKEPGRWDGVGRWQWEDQINGLINFSHSADALQALDAMLGIQ